MASRKTAPLESTLLVRKGEAAPAAVGSRRNEPIAITLKLDPELYWELKRLGMQTKPRKTMQDLGVEALKRYVQQRDEADSAGN